MRTGDAGAERQRREARLGWQLLAPALGIVLFVAFLPLGWTVWESLHLHDLRMPWLGRPFVGLDNYGELLRSDRFWAALGHTAVFTAVSVGLELGIGLALAIALNRVYRGRGLVRAAVLVPWALPTVVAGLLWRFMFEEQSGVANGVLAGIGAIDQPIGWLVDPIAAWVPIVAADVWKTAPFVALVLLAGLQTIDDSLYEAARIDGASPRQRFLHITLPLLKPAILVALIFRTLDAVRVFDLVYVMTGGGPGTATEPISLYAFEALLQHLRFGYGSALSVVIFVMTAILATIYVRLLAGPGPGRSE